MRTMQRRPAPAAAPFVEEELHERDQTLVSTTSVAICAGDRDFADDCATGCADRLAGSEGQIWCVSNVLPAEKIRSHDKKSDDSTVAGLQVNAMIPLLQVFKYVTTSVVVLSVAASAFVALFFMAFCDHGPVLRCLMYAAIAPGIALIEVALQLKAWALLKQGRRPGVSSLLMFLSIVPTLVGAAVFQRAIA